jgi:ABC-2 type transport system ATP-binding protein
MDLAEKLCEDILLINHGKTVSSGKLSDIKKNFGGNNIRLAFSGDNNFLKHFPEIIKFDHYHNFTDIQLKEEIIPSEFLKKLIQKFEVNHFSIIEPTLNKIFIDLIKENSGTV